jgi:MSHA biogenesis protein MshP
VTPANERDPQAGFGIVAAIFVLVLLASAGAAMLSLTSVQRSTTSIGLLGMRALFAAHAGLEWSLHEIGAAKSCSPISPTPPPDGKTLVLSEGALQGFAVFITCQEEQHSDGADYRIHNVVAIAEYGLPASSDYVRKRMRATVVTR